ncbi:MAG: tRNA uracil 4-sulfurtransferase ThiI [Candidatus Binatia bacterium]
MMERPLRRDKERLAFGAARRYFRSVVPAAERVIVAHFNEITLKLGHRPMFTARLLDNLRITLAGLGVRAVRSLEGRVVIDPGAASLDAVAERLRWVPGIANFGVARSTEPDMESLRAALEEELDAGWRPEGSFRVRARRSWKGFPCESPDIGRQLGAIIAQRTGATVDLTTPDTTVHVAVTRKGIYLSFSRQAGCGGLPVGTGGRMLLLLSGGIDSPVAGLRMMRRGCRIDAVHFHSVPFLDRSSQQKARELGSILARGQGTLRLYMVPFGYAQREVVRFVPRSLRVLLYRRLMMRIAGRLARQGKATALLTGESLGQVASQTLRNLAVIEEAAGLPVFRPLVGMDKLEITRYAEAAGTYPVSIVPDQDCCTLFVPRHPSTGASVSEVTAAEESLEIDRLVDDAVSSTTREELEPSWGCRDGRATATL